MQKLRTLRQKNMLMAVFWHHESLEVRSGELMIHPSIRRVLHRKHPFKIVHDFIEKIRNLVGGFRDIGMNAIEVILVELVGL